MKRGIAGLCALTCALFLSGCGRGVQPDSTPNTIGSPVAGKKVAYIMQMAPSDIFQMWSQSAEETAEKLGMEYDAFFVAVRMPSGRIQFPGAPLLAMMGYC